MLDSRADNRYHLIVKFIFNFTVIALTLSASVAGAQSGSELQRLAALADYIAADYPGAVHGGRVIVSSEYDEQRTLLAEARALGTRMAPLTGHERAAALLADDLARVAADVDARVDEAQVAADCRTLHRRLIDDFGLVLAPLAPPSVERARPLFAVACARCHGSDGRADTEEGRKLKPPPVSFLDAERMARISPALVFHALTFGIPNTAMASFDSLPASDRWSLAFFVVALRHQRQGPANPRGEIEFRKAHAPIAPTPSRLAELADAQLEALLVPAVPDEAVRHQVVDWLRVAAPFTVQPGGRFAEARRLLGQVGRAAGERSRARELAIAAYLEGIEPHEALLRAHDAAMAERIEKAFFALRRAVDQGSPDEIGREVAAATLLLDRADEMGSGGASVPFFAALAIALREGFELSLLIAALLAFVRKSGHADATRWVHVGWAAAVPAGIVTWFLVGAALAGARRELTEGVLTLVAAAMLLFVSHFVLGKLESRRWLKFLERRTIAAADYAGEAPGGRSLAGGRAGHHWPLALMAFVAAYREAIEIVLFFRALVVGAPGHGGSVALGALAGVIALFALVGIMSQLGRRLNPRPVMLASSLLLTALAISLVGQGIHALQEGGYVGHRPLAGPSLPSLGIYATVEGLAAQALVVALVLMPWWIERRRAAGTSFVGS